ncbi:glutamine--fructose-6-phosphate aminotransferase, partial [Archaeoglobales archaeon]
MCGIVGYIGEGEIGKILLGCLRKLEYRGYDSCGVAVLNDGITVKKDVGKIDEVNKKLNFASLQGKAGIAHTRWATHGEVSKSNAHPHTDCKGEIAIVHNGIIENYQELRRKLEALGHKFKSETDTEVLAHLIEEYAK